MQLTDFCVQKAELLSQKPSVILFKSKDYSSLSFAKILQWLQISSLQKNSVIPQASLSATPGTADFDSDLGSKSKFNVIPGFERESSPFISSIQKLDLDQDLDQLKMKLHTTFLGQTCTFWFGDLSLISAKKKRTDWLSFLETYQGPHQIIGWISSEDECKLSSKQSLIVTVPELFTSDMVQKISFLYQDQKPEIVAYFFGRLYRVQKEFSLEQLSLLVNYAGLIGKNMDSFFDQWLQHLIVSDISLFYVAQLFFEKKADQFFYEWHHVRGYYSDQFWTVFFSDQLFKAYFYIKAQGRIDQSQKSMTYGLPFSFLKHDWKFYKSEKLQHAHEQIYDVDIALKTGGSSAMLDGFLAKFFA